MYFRIVFEFLSSKYISKKTYLDLRNHDSKIKLFFGIDYTCEHTFPWMKIDVCLLVHFIFYMIFTAILTIYTIYINKNIIIFKSM